MGIAKAAHAGGLTRAVRAALIIVAAVKHTTTDAAVARDNKRQKRKPTAHAAPAPKCVARAEADVQYDILKTRRCPSKAIFGCDGVESRADSDALWSTHHHRTPPMTIKPAAAPKDANAP